MKDPAVGFPLPGCAEQRLDSAESAGELSHIGLDGLLLAGGAGRPERGVMPESREEQNAPIGALLAATRPSEIRAHSRSEMKPEGMSTSGLLTLRDAKAMTTDLHAQVGWVAAAAGRNWIGFSAPASCRRMASRRPRASRASVTRAAVLIARHPRRSRCGIWGGGSGSPDGRSSACERSSAVGKDVTCGYLPCAQYVSKRVSCGHVSAGQGQAVPRPPEP